jgi:hypothetical protein
MSQQEAFERSLCGLCRPRDDVADLRCFLGRLMLHRRQLRAGRTLDAFEHAQRDPIRHCAAGLDVRLERRFDRFGHAADATDLGTSLVPERFGALE